VVDNQDLTQKVNNQVPRGPSPSPATGGRIGDGAATGTLGPGYPVSLLLSGRKCLVVGGGPVAARKAEGLVRAGARVTVVAPEIGPRIKALPVRVLQRRYVASDLAEMWLVVAATGLSSVDRAVHRDGEAAGVLVNAADDPGACSVILPAVLRRGPVSVAVSTDGRSPALAGVLRDLIAEVIGPGVAEVAEVLGRAREMLHERGASTEGLAWGPLASALLRAQASGASRQDLEQILASSNLGASEGSRRFGDISRDEQLGGTQSIRAR